MFDGLVGQIIGSTLGFLGTKDTNDTNERIANSQMTFNHDEAELGREFSDKQAWDNRNFQLSALNESEQFNSAEAQKNRDYQTQMASTQYQRAVGDMQAAGLNPMLAYSHGGNAAPGGSAASVGTVSGSTGPAPTASYSSMPRIGNKFEAAVQSAAAIADINNKLKQGDLIDAQAEATRTQATLNTASAGQVGATTEKIITGDIPKLRHEIELIDRQSISESAKQVLITQQAALTRLEALVTAEKIPLTEAQKQLVQIQARLQALEIPGAENAAAKESTSFGAAMPYATDVMRLINGAARARYMFTPSF